MNKKHFLIFFCLIFSFSFGVYNYNVRVIKNPNQKKSKLENDNSLTSFKNTSIGEDVPKKSLPTIKQNNYKGLSDNANKFKLKKANDRSKKTSNNLKPDELELLSDKKAMEKEILANLQGIESELIKDGKGIDYNTLKKINDDSFFYDALNEYESNAYLDESSLEISKNFSDSFLDVANSLGGKVDVNSFYCGEASCIGSITSYNDDDWNEFLSARSSRNSEDGIHPFYAFSNFPNVNIDGSTEHRIFFTTLPSANRIVMRLDQDGG